MSTTHQGSGGDGKTAPRLRRTSVELGPSLTFSIEEHVSAVLERWNEIYRQRVHPKMGINAVATRWVTTMANDLDRKMARREITLENVHKLFATWPGRDVNATKSKSFPSSSDGGNPRNEIRVGTSGALPGQQVQAGDEDSPVPAASLSAEDSSSEPDDVTGTEGTAAAPTGETSAKKTGKKRGRKPLEPDNPYALNTAVTFRLERHIHQSLEKWAEIYTSIEGVRTTPTMIARRWLRHMARELNRQVDRGEIKLDDPNLILP